MRTKPTPFNDLTPIPSDPQRVLSGAYETAGQIHKRTGLNLRELCESIEAWAKRGVICAGVIKDPWCSIPVFKIREVWDR